MTINLGSFFDELTKIAISEKFLIEKMQSGARNRARGGVWQDHRQMKWEKRKTNYHPDPRARASSISQDAKRLGKKKLHKAAKNLYGELSGKKPSKKGPLLAGIAASSLAALGALAYKANKKRKEQVGKGETS